MEQLNGVETTNMKALTNKCFRLGGARRLTIIKRTYFIIWFDLAIQSSQFFPGLEYLPTKKHTSTKSTGKTTIPMNPTVGNKKTVA